MRTPGIDVPVGGGAQEIDEEEEPLPPAEALMLASPHAAITSNQIGLTFNMRSRSATDLCLARRPEHGSSSSASSLSEGAAGTRLEI